MKLLVTGFGPFGQVENNPSWEAVRRLPERIGRHEITRLQLPVVYGKAAEAALKKARECGAEAIICTGVAVGRKVLTPELVAVNWRMADIPDAQGQSYHGEKIDPAMPAALMTELPVMDMVAAAKGAGVRAALSLSAGAYVCNDIYWHMLERSARSLFIHVPSNEDMDAETAARGISACIEAIG